MAFKQPPSAGPGLQLFVKVTRDRVVVRRAVSITRAPRTGLREPIVTEERSRRAKTSAAELVLDVLDASGHLIERFGWPATSIVYYDHVSPNGDLSGGPMELEEWEGQIRVPMRSTAARYLFFSRTDFVLGSDASRTLTKRVLGVYDLGPGDPGAPPWPLPWPWPPEPIPHWGPTWEHLREVPPDPIPPVNPRAIVTIAPAVTVLIDSGRHVDSFDIVIMAEGFQEAELDLFHYRATLLAFGLVLTPPFSDFLDRINVYAVRTPSVDSGVTLTPEGIVKNTYFKSEGYFGKPVPTFIGTNSHDTVDAAVAAAVPPGEDNLRFIIVNYPSDGGASTFRDKRLVFLTLIAAPDLFINTAAHEAAHAVADACEEYLGCTENNPARIPKNQATQDQVDAGDVWWKELALDTELNEGQFRAVHTVGDPMDSECQPIMSTALTGMLGLYWGCQDTDPPNPGLCNAYCDTTGAKFYRAMAKCKMRRTRYMFCRVCSKLISDAILEVAP